MVNQRETAIRALMKVDLNGGYSNIVLQKVFSEKKIPAEDKPFITALFYGVLDRLITLDFIIGNFVKKPIKKITPITLFALRIAIYQIIYMDKVPHSAAVNESVNIVKNSKEKYNASFVNAVLRNFLRQGAQMPKDNSLHSLEIRYSCPKWIIKSFIDDYGTETAFLVLEHFLSAPEITARINTTLISDDEFTKEMIMCGVEFEFLDLPHTVCFKQGVDIKKLDAFKNGHIYVQDIPSQVAVLKLAVKPGERVLDMCASPGGKSFTASVQAGGKCEITSFDIHENRVRLISEGAKRLKLKNINAAVWDSRDFNESIGKFDAVICDVPCSGLGVIRRKPEIKYKTDIDLSKLKNTQTAILENALKYVKKGGKILYSTCTLRKSENEDIVRSCLDKHGDFGLEYEHTFLPVSDKTDGFYFAIIKSR